MSRSPFTASLPTRLRIQISRVNCQRYRERIADLELADRHVEQLMDELDMYDVSSDHYYIYMSQRIAIWADLDEVRLKHLAEKELLRTMVDMVLRRRSQ